MFPLTFVDVCVLFQAVESLLQSNEARAGHLHPLTLPGGRGKKVLPELLDGREAEGGGTTLIVHPEGWKGVLFTYDLCLWFRVCFTSHNDF